MDVPGNVIVAVMIFGIALAACALLVGRLKSGRSGYAGNNRFIGFDRFELSQWKGHLPDWLYTTIYYAVHIGIALFVVPVVIGAVLLLWQAIS